MTPTIRPAPGGLVPDPIPRVGILLVRTGRLGEAPAGDAR